MWLCMFSAKQFEDTFENTPKKPNKCNQYDFALSYTSTLKTHLKTHSGGKLNKCNQCDYASSNASDLVKHLKTHSGEKSKKCNQCDFASSYAHHLRRHLKMHSGESLKKCTDVTMPLLRQALWGHIWKYTVEKSQTNAKTGYLRRVFLTIWKCLLDIWNKIILDECSTVDEIDHVRNR